MWTAATVIPHESPIINSNRYYDIIGRGRHASIMVIARSWDLSQFETLRREDRSWRRWHYRWTISIMRNYSVSHGLRDCKAVGISSRLLTTRIANNLEFVSLMSPERERASDKNGSKRIKTTIITFSNQMLYQYWVTKSYETKRFQTLNKYMKSQTFMIVHT